jgi:hypothetical protein
MKPDISGIAPFFIVRNVPAALSFHRDRLDITFQGPEPDDIFFGIVERGQTPTMACVDSNSTRPTATCCFSAVLVHETARRFSAARWRRRAWWPSSADRRELWRRTR